MRFSIFKQKLKNYLWSRFIRITRNRKYYPIIYRSFWHNQFIKGSKPTLESNFYSAVPNPGAGIGHQMANWIAGYWFAQQFGLQFAHTPFSSKSWEDFLAFGENETSVKELLNNRYKKIRLPLFDEDNISEVTLITNIIASYRDKKVVFIAEQDQFYRDQYGVMEQIKQKFYGAKSRQKDQLIYSKENFNIAIHVRRGDIVIVKETNNPNLAMRWQDNSYFEKVLSSVTSKLKVEKPIAIYLFSQGEQKDFHEFEKFENIHFCLDMNAQDSFLHLVYADLLITSKSSFSYKPALLSKGIKVCPKNFWHSYPTDHQWILVNEDTTFDSNELNNFS